MDRTGRNFRTRLQDSQAVTSNFRGITGPRMGLSLLPSDLNSTNLLLSGIVDLLDEGLGTGESDTSDQVHTLYPFILCTKIEKIIRVYSVLKFCLQLIFVTLVKNILASLALWLYYVPQLCRGDRLGECSYRHLACLTTFRFI